MAAAGDLLDARAGNGPDRAPALLGAGPVVLTVDHEHRHLDVAIALLRLVPEMGVAQEAQNA